MKYIFLIINYFIVSSISLNTPIKRKICVDCKFFIKDLYTENKFGRCSLFIKPTEDDYSIVDGSETNYVLRYNYCYNARQFDSMCGIEGKLYIKK